MGNDVGVSVDVGITDVDGTVDVRVAVTDDGGDGQDEDDGDGGDDDDDDDDNDDDDYFNGDDVDAFVNGGCSC